MNANGRPFEDACAAMCSNFFEKFPNNDLRDLVSQTLLLLLKRQTDFPGEPGGWAGGVVSAVASKGCGVPGILNADLEKAFGTTMGTIRKRAAQVKRALELEFTLRDEANTICAYAFRNGPLERIHHQYGISQSDMKEFMINASEHLAKLMAMKQQSPGEYDRFIRHFHSQFCSYWER
jgi:hypothetical protein